VIGCEDLLTTERERVLWSGTAGASA